MGDVPRVVLTRGLSGQTTPDAQRLEAEHRADQSAMAAISWCGRQHIAARSGHHVPLDEPELVVTTIRDMLASVRR